MVSKSSQVKSSQKKLTINTEKTKIMIFKKKINKKLHQTFQLNGGQIEIVDSFKYLGIKLYRTGNWSVEMDSRSSSARFAFNELKNVILKDKNTSWSTNVALINSMVESILLYGAEIWEVETQIQLRQHS